MRLRTDWIRQPLLNVVVTLTAHLLLRGEDGMQASTKS